LERSVSTIFISYRRRDTALIAELLAQRLHGRFRVFFDLEAIELGSAFMMRIQKDISEADTVLIVIGADWDPARLQEQADVVAYELRLARRFRRRTIPVVVEPAVVPSPSSLPDDLTWLSELNAFFVPEPPGHSAAMVQLGDLLEETTTATTEPPSRTAFAIPHDPGMLMRQEGNIPFREVPAMDDAHVCRIASDAGAIWLASSSAVELRVLADGRALCTADERSVEWLHPIEGDAIVATSGIGYHAPDTIRLKRFVCRDGRFEKSGCGFGWSWQTPPLALSPDGRFVAGYFEKPGSREAQLGFVKLDTNDQPEYLGHLVLISPDGRVGRSADQTQFGCEEIELRNEEDIHGSLTLKVSSLTFDQTGERLYVLGRQADRWHVSSIDVASRSVDWSHEVDADLFEHGGKGRTTGPGLHYWTGQESLLLVVASRVFELESSSGALSREVLALQGCAPVLATDATTSLACAVDEASVIVFSAVSKTVVSLAHGATGALACDVHDGHVVVLVDDGDRRRLLIAEDVPEALEDSPAEPLT
jgi:TIR domain